MSGSELGSSGLSDPCREGMFSTSMGRPGHLSRKMAEHEEDGEKLQKRAAKSGRPWVTAGRGTGHQLGPVCPSHWTL